MHSCKKNSKPKYSVLERKTIFKKIETPGLKPRVYESFLPHWKDFQINLSSFPFLKGSPSIKQIVDGVFPSQVHSFLLPHYSPLCLFVKRALNLSKYFLLPRSAYFILDFTFRRNYVFIEMIQGTQMIFYHLTHHPFPICFEGVCTNAL